MTASQPLGIASDRPLDDRTKDRLDRAPFADRIAGILSSLPRGSSLAVGVYGPWGDGKTTVLNFLRESLSINDQIVVRDFNPWRLADEEAMLRGFFLVLSEAIGASLSTWREKLGNTVGKLSRVVSWILTPVTFFFGPAEKIERLLTKVGKYAESGDSVKLEELRYRVVTYLKQSEKRVVVLIDDLDRLDRNEIYRLFQLIKACTDFPNVCFVLAFDEVVVAKALGDRYGEGGESSGRAFLEKIVQVPLKVPVAAKERLRELCFNQVDLALKVAGVELTTLQTGEFVSGFERGASIRLTTPREAKRFGNGLMFALPLLVGETNPVDLLLVEALRAFFPDIYEVVRNNQTDFSGVEEEHRKGREEGTRAEQLLNPLLNEMPSENAAAAKTLLVDLFPRLGGVYGYIGYGSDRLQRWTREKRISSPRYCARYFTYTVPSNDVPDAEIEALLKEAQTGNEDPVASLLEKLLVEPRASRLIEKLRDIETTVDARAAETLAIALVKLGDNIPNTPALLGVAGSFTQAAILVSHLLRRIPDRAKRFDAAQRATDVVSPLLFGAECVRWLYVTDKPEKQDSNTLTEQELVTVRQVLVDRIKALAADVVPLFDPDLPHGNSLLGEWYRAEGRDPVQAHLLKVFSEDPKQVARFLESQAPLAWGDGDLIPRVGQLQADQLKNIDLVFDLDLMADLVRQHCPGNFDNPEWFPDDEKPLEERLAEQFMYVYNSLRTKGDSLESQGDILQTEDDNGVTEDADNKSDDC